MKASREAEAVLITGVYGAGKTTVLADIGKVLGDHGERYGLLDVDWLGWFDAGCDAATHRQVWLSNVTTLCSVYLTQRVRRLALAWSIRDRTELEEVEEAVPAPLRVVRLDVSANVMRRRLLASPTERRSADGSAGSDPVCPYRATRAEDRRIQSDMAALRVVGHRQIFRRTCTRSSVRTSRAGGVA